MFTGLGCLLQMNALVLVQFDALVTDLWDRSRVRVHPCLIYRLKAVAVYACVTSWLSSILPPLGNPTQYPTPTLVSLADCPGLPPHT